MSPFMTRLAGLTTLGHVTFLVALVQLGVPWWLAPVIATASVAMFVNRANVYLRGEKRSRLSIALVDVPYFIHWTAGFLAISRTKCFVKFHKSPWSDICAGGHRAGCAEFESI